MAFPEDGLSRIVELYYDGAWQDVSSYVYARDPIVITHGSTSEKDVSQPSQCTFTLDNRDGRFSPRNQASPLFGKIGRNTPARVSIEGVGPSWLAMSGDAPEYISTPDSAGLSITGDIDIRIDVSLANWHETTGLCGKRTEVSDERSWTFYVLDGGSLYYAWYTDGITVRTATSTLQLPHPHGGRATVRVTHDVDNGAGENTVTFYYSLAPGTSGPWRQLGDPVTSVGATSIYDSTSAVFVGVALSNTLNYHEGRVHSFELRNGIDGTIVANPDCNQADGTTSFSDGTNTWTVTAAEITSRRVRFSGEVAAWPVKRDQSGRDVWVEVEAAGILRRLSQGSPPPQSAMRTGILGIGDDVKGYWPLEDVEGSSVMASGLSGGFAMSAIGTPTLATFGDFACSMPLPTLTDGAGFSGRLRPYTSVSSEGQLRFLLAVPDGGDTDGAVIVSVAHVASTVIGRVDVFYYTGGALGVTVYAPDGSTINATGAIAYNVNGKLLLVSLKIELGAGASLDFTMDTYEVGATDVGTSSWNVAGPSTFDGAASITVNRGALLTGTSVGHVYWQDGVTSVFDLYDQVNAYAGEAAGTRIERVCSEAGIDLAATIGAANETTIMGPQPIAPALDVLRDCELADGGWLHDAPDRLALVYRTRESLTAPGARLELDGSTDLVAIEATDDDQFVANDLTVTRSGGSSARATLDDGALSVQAPPDGVGRYGTEVTLNVHTDVQLPGEASWRLAQGTVDRPRFPTVGVNLARADLVDDPAVTAEILGALVVDRLTLASPPTGLPAEDQTLYVVGRTEVLDTHEVLISWPGVPRDAYEAAVYDYEAPGIESRYSSDGSTANGVHTAGTTSLSVATASGPLWTHADGDFTIIIPQTGERMTVTGVAGSSSPQTFTVTRGVESTTAVALAGGETVELAHPVRYIT